MLEHSPNCPTGINHKVRAPAILLSAFLGVGCGLCAPFIPRANAQAPVHAAAEGADTARLAQIIRDDPGALTAEDSQRNTALHLAALHGHVTAARLLMKAGASANTTNATGMTPLMLAAKAGESDVVKLLLRNGADPKIKDAQGWTALKWAKKTGHYRAAVMIALAAARP